MQVVANGIISGLTISLLAVAFSAVYVPTRVFYIALGAIYAAVPFVALEGIRRGAPMVLSIAIAVAAGVALSLLCEVASHRILARRGAGEGVQMVAAIGAYIVIVQAVVLLWGNETKVLTQGISTPIHLGDVTLSTAQVVAGSVAIVLLALFALFLKHTAIGLRFRALAENPSEFALRGHSVAVPVSHSPELLGGNDKHVWRGCRIIGYQELWTVKAALREPETQDEVEVA